MENLGTNAINRSYAEINWVKESVKDFLSSIYGKEELGAIEKLIDPSKKISSKEKVVYEMDEWERSFFTLYIRAKEQERKLIKKIKNDHELGGPNLNYNFDELALIGMKVTKLKLLLFGNIYAKVLDIELNYGLFNFHDWKISIRRGFLIVKEPVEKKVLAKKEVEMLVYG